MPLALLLIGVLLLTVAIRNQQTAFVQLLRQDFSGPGNFMYWVLAVLIIGSIGYIPKAKPVSNLFLVLLLIVLVIGAGKKGVFSKLTAALGGTNTAAQNATVTSLVGAVVNTVTGAGPTGSGTGTGGGVT